MKTTMKSKNTTVKSKKMTKKKPAARRWYDDACGTAHALELLGERWALLIIRELIFGPRRFSELKANLPGISAQVLTQRLEGFEAAGVATRRILPPPANVQVYELTEWGYECEPILQVMGRWAARSPRHDPSLPLSAASMMQSLKTMISAARAGDMKARIGFRFGREEFTASIQGGEIDIVRGDAGAADAVFECEPEMMAAITYAGAPVAEAEQTGALTITGDRKLARRFLTLFELPPKAA